MSNPGLAFLSDLNLTCAGVRRLIDKDYPGDGLEGGREVLKHLIESNIRAVHKHSQSPIETVFFTSLLLHFVRNFPASCVIQRPTPDVETAMHKHRDASERAFLDPSTPKGPGTLHFHTFEIGLFHAFHLSLQPRFKDFYGPGRHIRVDALVWIPSNPQCRVVVECDGFEYHSSKERFTADRKRDRALAQKGFAVRRYSGSEIIAVIPTASEDLFNYLVDAFEFDYVLRARWEATMTSRSERTPASEGCDANH